jgi:hypothetical protein
LKLVSNQHNESKNDETLRKLNLEQKNFNATKKMKENARNPFSSLHFLKLSQLRERGSNASHVIRNDQVETRYVLTPCIINIVMVRVSFI